MKIAISMIPSYTREMVFSLFGSIMLFILSSIGDIFVSGKGLVVRG